MDFRYSGPGMLAQEDPAQLTVGIVYDAAVVVEHHGLAMSRIARGPAQSRLAGIARTGEVHPGGAHLLRERLGLGRIARALFAAFRIVEAEGEFGRVPRAGILQHRRLPREVILVG